MRTARGFTLVEILMVLILLGLVSALGAWRMIPALDHERVRRAAGIVMADLRYAQNMAARHRQPVAVIVNPSLQMYLIREMGGTTVYRERFLGEESDFDLDRLMVTPSNSVEIFPNGVTGATTTFTVGIDDYTRQIKLTRTGQVRVVSLGGVAMGK
jgi:prepilin-type N-terminal cleavage/methylation domain-containing protein